jgi:hypothetical protein
MCYTSRNVGSVAYYTFVDTIPANVVKEASFYSEKVNNLNCIKYGGK